MPEEVAVRALFYRAAIRDEREFSAVFKNNMRVQGLKLMTMLAIVVL